MCMLQFRKKHLMSKNGQYWNDYQWQGFLEIRQSLPQSVSQDKWGPKGTSGRQQGNWKCFI